MADLTTQLGPLVLRNPVIAASGTCGYGLEPMPLSDMSLLGAICTKGLSLKPRAGGPPPRLWETSCGLLNAIGLANIGVQAFLDEKLPLLRKTEITVIVNVLG